MFKSAFEKASSEALPILGGITGGIGGGFSKWLDIYGSVIMSAIIFAVVGGLFGFVTSKFLSWIWSGICRVCKTKKIKK